MAEAAVSEPLTLAVSKGRILEEAAPLLERAGIAPREAPETSRRLIVDTADSNVRLLVLRAADVPTYVEHGGADLGVAGKDVLIEHGGEGLYEPLDLGIARCSLMTAGASATPPVGRRLRVATKFVEATRAFYAARGEQVEIIKLYGSMELAPLVGMADRIVDLVDTGKTLRANGLEPLEQIAEISSRLIVNPASMKTKHASVRHLMERFRDSVGDGAGQQRAT